MSVGLCLDHHCQITNFGIERLRVKYTTAQSNRPTYYLEQISNK